MENIINIFISLILITLFVVILRGFVKGTVHIDTKNSLQDYTCITLLYALVLFSNCGDLLTSVLLFLK